MKSLALSIGACLFALSAEAQINVVINDTNFNDGQGETTYSVLFIAEEGDSKTFKEGDGFKIWYAPDSARFFKMYATEPGLYMITEDNEKADYFHVSSVIFE